MKTAKAFDKETGILRGLLDARSVTEETRRAYVYQCRYNACDCTMHWRKAVHGKGNTQPVPPTFVKNRASDHKDKCPGDLERIHRENINYTTLKDGQIHVRVNFPLGSSNVDRHPLGGYLSDEIMQAAKNDRIIRPFGSLSSLAKFFEKNFGGLESEAARDVIIHYQGQSVEWSKLFKGSDRYEKLYIRSQNHTYSDAGKETPPIVTVVRPYKEISPNREGKRRFECEEQEVVVDGRKQRIVPVIVCSRSEPTLASTMHTHMEARDNVLVTARPFHPGLVSRPAQYGQLRISLLVHKLEQLTMVEPKYWHPSYQKVDQLTIFGGTDTIKAPLSHHPR